MARYDLTDFEWSVIEPLLPNKPRRVPRVHDRRVLNGIFWVLRSGAPIRACWADLPERYGPKTTCYNRFRRWTKAGVWDRIMDALTEAYDGDIQMIDGHQRSGSSLCRHKKKPPGSLSWTKPGRSYNKNPCSHQPSRTADKVGHHARPDS